MNCEKLKSLAESHEINFRYTNENDVTISFAEPHTQDDVDLILSLFEQLSDSSPTNESHSIALSADLKRADNVLTQPIFNRYHSESKMMRYLKKLENKDLSLVHSMIPLGSCTMKLNAASELIPITNPSFSNLHPFAPLNQVEGYHTMFDELSEALCECTGFAGMSLQPNSGAQGEYTGLMVIRAYHESRGDFQRKIMIIPSSAHGTNPASAVMAGFQVVVTSCDENGNINIDELKKVAEENKDTLGGLMVTYPSTHGVFEEAIKELQVLFENGVGYMDGANMNAQVGVTNPGNIGADVCHLNLSKPLLFLMVAVVQEWVP